MIVYGTNQHYTLKRNSMTAEDSKLSGTPAKYRNSHVNQYGTKFLEPEEMSKIDPSTLRLIRTL